MNDYDFCVLKDFKKIYATSSSFSWTNAEQFSKFCEAAGIQCDEISIDKYFNKGMCDGAFLTKEYTYDANILKKYFMERIASYSNVDIKFGVQISSIQDIAEWGKISNGFSFKCYLCINKSNYQNVGL
jgi:hypothetical protein